MRLSRSTLLFRSFFLKLMEDGAHGVLTAGALRKGDEFAIIRNRKEVVGHAAEDHNKNKPAQRRLAVSLIQ